MGDPFAELDDDERDVLRPADHPRRVEPMLATLEHGDFSREGWVYERKLDGIRLVAHVHGDEVRLRTRNGEDRTDRFAEVARALGGQQITDVVLDGEVVVFDGDTTSFSALQQRRGPPVYFAFDVLHLQGRDCRLLPLRTRKEVLKRLWSWDDPLRFTPHRNGDGTELLEEACGRGWEGLIAKDAAAPYRDGARSKAWRKLKCEARQEFVVGGWTEPKGSRVGLGALLLGVHDEPGGELVYVGRVGTGFTDQLLRRLVEGLEDLEVDEPPFSTTPDVDAPHWVEPRLVCEVAFTEWTHGDRLRHPRFLGMRSDKDAVDVVRER